jgi:hypothetical protein
MRFIPITTINKRLFNYFLNKHLTNLDKSGPFFVGHSLVNLRKMGGLEMFLIVKIKSPTFPQFLKMIMRRGGEAHGKDIKNGIAF